MPLPNLIIGAGRSGTTSLYEHLRQHPQVVMSRAKDIPVDRAFSSYLAHHRDGWEPAATLELALDDQERQLRESGSFGTLLNFGFYARHLSRYRWLSAWRID